MISGSFHFAYKFFANCICITESVFAQPALENDTNAANLRLELTNPFKERLDKLALKRDKAW